MCGGGGEGSEVAGKAGTVGREEAVAAVESGGGGEVEGGE
jgi:hypothetical protein